MPFADPRDDGCLVSLVRGTPAQQLVTDGAQRVDVGARVDRPRRIELLRRDVRDRPFQMAAHRIARAQPEVEDAGQELRVEHDVRRLQVAVLQPERVRVMDRLADLNHDPRPLRELERRPDAPELEAVHELHDDDGRARVRPEVEDLDDPAVGKERERTRLPEKAFHAGCPAGGAFGADDFRRDDAVEPEVLELEDLAHAARADPLDRLEAVEEGQGPAGREHRRRDGVAVQRGRQREVPLDERAQRLRQVGTAAAQIVKGQPFAVQHVVLDEAGEPRLQVGAGPGHRGGSRTSGS